MLHLHNGDVSSDTAKRSSVPGEHFAFREALIGGPAPSGLSPSAWRHTRAQHLAETYGANVNECEQQLLAQEEKIASFRDHDEVVLWFEHDLFCQIHLIYLLNWFRKQQRRNTRLSLICIGDFPDKPDFRGLGELSPEELASLFPARQPVTDQQLALASSAWEAYGSEDPNEIQKVLANETTSLPFLDKALEAHLRRFPSTFNGLGQVENRALELISSGLKRFVDLFARFVEVEIVYGLGDLQFWEALLRMSDARRPLLTRKDQEDGSKEIAPEVLRKARFEITELGRTTLKGKTDFVKWNGIDLWLGGVHLEGDNSAWRWDEASGKIVPD